MAIKINGVTVIDNNRNITDVENVGDSNTVYYGDGSNLSNITVGGASRGGLSQVVGWNNSKTALNDGENGRLDVFGDGNFTVFYEPGTFDTAGITSMRVRVVGAGSSGHMTRACRPTDPSGYVFACNAPGGGGAGGGYAHKVFSTVPGGSINVKVGTPWSCCSPSTTVGTSCFGSTLCASGGVDRCTAGTGVGGDVNYSGGVGCKCGQGGSAGSQLGDGCPDGRIAGVPCKGCSYCSPSVCCYCYVNSLRPKGVERFPFDIFNGEPGSDVCVRRIFGLCSAYGSAACGPGAQKKVEILFKNATKVDATGSGGAGGNGLWVDGCPPMPGGSPNYQGGPIRVTGTSGGDGGAGGGGGGGYKSCGQTAGRGGYGGGGGGAAYLVYNMDYSPPGGQAACAAFRNCCNCVAAGEGGPGLVIVEW